MTKLILKQEALDTTLRLLLAIEGGQVDPADLPQDFAYSLDVDTKRVWTTYKWELSTSAFKVEATAKLDSSFNHNEREYPSLKMDNELELAKFLLVHAGRVPGVVGTLKAIGERMTDEMIVSRTFDPVTRKTLRKDPVAMASVMRPCIGASVLARLSRP